MGKTVNKMLKDTAMKSKSNLDITGIPEEEKNTPMERKISTLREMLLNVAN